MLIGYEMGITTSYPTTVGGIIIICFITNAQRNNSKWATKIGKKMRTPTIFIVHGIWAHIPLALNQSKLRTAIYHS